MINCPECDQRFVSNAEMDSHFHAVKTVSTEPLIITLHLPDGCTPGRQEAAVAFADAIREANARYPDQTWQYVVFDREGGVDGGTTVFLGIANP